MTTMFAGATHRQTRAEMRALHVGGRFPVPEFLLGLLAAASAASALLLAAASAASALLSLVHL